MKHILMLLLVTAIIAPAAQAQVYDYGDAPVLNNPAFHETVGPMLGTTRDADPGHQPTPNADGDDNDANGDDEDGVTFLGPFIPGQQTTVRVVVTGAANNSRISGYFDWTGNNHWNHLTNELAIHNKLVNEGINDIVVTVPANAVEGFAYVRIKLYNGDSPGTPASGHRSEGEVEDYMIMIGAPVPTEDSTWGKIKSLYQ